MSINEDLTVRKPIATGPYDANDPARFGQLLETAKDAFKSELYTFFNIKSSDILTKITEVPNIQKFNLGAVSGEQSLETVTNVIMSYADTPDKFPMIAITSASLREKPLGIGNNFSCHVQYPSTISGSKSGPFRLTHGWTLEITTWPLGTVDSATVTTLTIASGQFADLLSATITELVNTINKQALYMRAYANADGSLRLETGGPCARACPNYIEVTGGSAGLLLALGLTVGQSDIYTNTENPPMNRYSLAGEMTINIDVISDDLNTRMELADLVFDFFAYTMEKRNFQFIGRSYFEKDLNPEEWWHVILNRQFGWNSEYATQKYGGEGYDYIYSIRGSVPITIVDFINKKLVTAPVFLEHSDLFQENTLPDGDFGGRNFLRDSKRS